jgi:hypothetical protein|uniref:HNH endonuclease n=1 Tax=uncultured virus TaxID=340016 RepID=D5L2E6_9VIRU|nr:HNH endonuclease [uncultured virus]
MQNVTKKYKDKEWLRVRYIDEQLSTREIAELADCSAPTIQNWLDKHDIEKRSKSEAAKIRAEKHPHTIQAGAEALREHGVNSWEYWSEEERENFREWLSEQRQGDRNPMAGKTGPDHHNWKESKTDSHLYQTKAWRELRQEALERSNSKCEACGSEERLVGHHVIPLSSGGEPLDINNVSILCRSCHMEWEGLFLAPDCRGNKD